MFTIEHVAVQKRIAKLGKPRCRSRRDWRDGRRSVLKNRSDDRSVGDGPDALNFDAAHTSRISESGQVHAKLPVPAALVSDAGVVKLADARDSKSRGGHPP